jgi:hypothetical protein
MALQISGFDGSVVESDWAALSNNTGSRYSVGGGTDFQVTPRSAATLTSNVAVGTAYGCGVKVTNDAQITVIHTTAPNSGTRWDAVVLRRNWSGTGGTATVVVIAGGATRSMPTRNNTPGVLDDQVLALVPINAGQSIPGTPVDCRWLPSKVITVGDLLAVTDPVVGMEAVVPSGSVAPASRWRYELDTTGNAAWTRDTTSAAARTLTVISGTSVMVAATTPTSWSTGGMICEAVVDRNTVDLYIEARCGTDIPITLDTGNIFDTPVGTIDAALAPDRTVDFRFMYKTGTGGQYRGDGQITANGVVTITSAQPGTPEIAAQPVNVNSIRITATYLLRS